ncbi:hypothetical protein [Bradyrhizobium archetypum]|uniref:HNH endonuclease n=1 Tax=Bradyrhizobium archetypum TaxID=2721160 RepID=A0A7Y4H6V3_9BRAD|nr:hypothetical protein [Bradyrhizobium archetypum]NOJ47832.1 hypothetical protein [Bradyrhizobium archetypum]
MAKTCPYCTKSDVKFSGEHIISAAVLREVFGNPVKNNVSADHLRGKVLKNYEPTSNHVCRTCNSKLAPCDSAGVDLIKQIFSHASVANIGIDLRALRLNWLIKTHLNHMVATRPKTKAEYTSYSRIFDGLINLQPVSTDLYALCLEAFDTDESYYDGTRKEGIGYFNYRSVDFAHTQTIVSSFRIKSLSTYIILPMNSDYGLFGERVAATIGEMRQDFKITPARVPAGDLHSNASILVSSVVPRSKIDAIQSAEAARGAQAPPNATAGQ